MLRSRKYLQIFRCQDHWDVPLILLFTLINMLVLVNALGHVSYRGYDAHAFLDYITALSQGHLPTRDETSEFFTPPLPFVLPALVMSVTGCTDQVAAKVGQLSHVLVSMGALSCFIMMMRRVGMGRVAVCCSLGLFGMVAVYYRTFAMVRGEPWVLLFVMLAMDQMTALFIECDTRWRRIVLLGVAIGLGLLSRQWAIFFVPVLLCTGVAAWWQYPQSRSITVRIVTVSLLVGFVLSSWFYFHLKITHGTFRAFNRDPQASLSLSNQPATFYTALHMEDVFTHPRRPYMANCVWPILYTDTYGDYWGYLHLYMYNARNETYWPIFYMLRLRDPDNLPDYIQTNFDRSMPYLARVSRISVLHAVILLAGFMLVLWRQWPIKRTRLLWTPSTNRLLSMQLILFCSTVLGYGWFLVMYQNPGTGDTIKPTYILHVFPFLAMCGGLLLEVINRKWPRLFTVLIIMLVCMALHNLPVMISHNGPLRWVMPTW